MAQETDIKSARVRPLLSVHDPPRIALLLKLVIFLILSACSALLMGFTSAVGEPELPVREDGPSSGSVQPARDQLTSSAPHAQA